MLINEIFDITAGQVMTRITTESNEVEVRKVLVPRAIESGMVVDSELANNKMKNKLEDQKMTMVGDIVLKLSTPYDSCYIDSEHVGLVVPSFCVIMRQKDKSFDPNYLIACLNSKKFSDQVKILITGRTVGILSVGQLKSLDIPEADINTQRQIGNEYIKMAKNKKLFSKLMQLEQEKIETMISIGGKNE